MIKNIIEEINMWQDSLCGDISDGVVYFTLETVKDIISKYNKE